jgi:hypothetical protein
MTTRHRRRFLLALAAPLSLLAAGCESDPSTGWLGGIGAAQLEFLTEQFATNPRYAPEVNPSVLQQLQAARAEMRDYLGIPPGAATQTVITSLLRAADALDAGSVVQAEAALAGPDFTAGPEATLARLSAMPRLPRVANAAGAAAGEITRLSGRRG